MFNIHIEFEKWKYNKEYNVYVSTLGRIKDNKKKIIEPLISSSGYFTVSVNDKLIHVHSLVMNTFRGPKEKGMTIDHLNSNRRDNRLKNLEYVSLQENLKRAKDKLLQDEILVESIGDNPDEILDLLFKNKIYSVEHLKNILTSKLVRNTIKKTSNLNSITAKTPDAWVRKYLRYHDLNGVSDIKTFTYRVAVYAEMNKEYCGYKLSKINGEIVGERVC